MTEIPIDFTKIKNARRFETIREQYSTGKLSHDEMQEQILSLTDEEINASGFFHPRPILIEEAEQIDDLFDSEFNAVFKAQKVKTAWENKDDPRAKEIIRSTQPESQK